MEMSLFKSIPLAYQLELVELVTHSFKMHRSFLLGNLNLLLSKEIDKVLILAIYLIRFDLSLITVTHMDFYFILNLLQPFWVLTKLV
jgi:hypothetical protein